MLNLPSWKRFWSPLVAPTRPDSEGIPDRPLSVLALTGFSVVVLQTSIFPRFSLVPDILLILCVYLALSYPSVGGAAVVFFLGYLFDSGSGMPAGRHAAALSVVFAAVVLVSRGLWLSNPVSVLGLVLLAIGLKTLTLFSLSRLGPLASEVSGLELSSVAWDAALTMLLTPLVFTLLAPRQPLKMNRPNRSREDKTIHL